MLAHWVPIVAVNEQGQPYAALVPRETSGVNIINDWSGFGQRTTASGTVELNQVPVREEYLIPIYQAFERPTPAGAISQFIQAAVDAGIARGAIEETIHYVKNHSRAWVDSGLEKASDDPYTIANIGDLKIKLRAAEAVLDLAGDAIDQAIADTTEEHVNQATLLVAEAKVLTTEVAILAANKLLNCREHDRPCLSLIWTAIGVMLALIPCMIQCVGNITLSVITTSMASIHLVMHGAKVNKK